MLKASINSWHTPVLVKVREEAVAYFQLFDLLGSLSIEIISIMHELAESTKH